MALKVRACTDRWLCLGEIRGGAAYAIFLFVCLSECMCSQIPSYYTYYRFHVMRYIRKFVPFCVVAALARRVYYADSNSTLQSSMLSQMLVFLQKQVCTGVYEYVGGVCV